MNRIILLFFIASFNLCFSQPPGNGMIFNGTSNYYEVPDNSSIDLSGSFTIEAWINPCDTVSNVVLSKHWCASANGSYFVQILNGRLKWGWVPLGGCTASNIYMSNLGFITNNTWRHIAIVHTPTSVSMYNNGVLVLGSLTTGSYSGVFKNNSEPLRIGVYRWLGGTYGAFYNGRMDEIRVWDRVRTSAQILSKYNVPLVGNEAGLKLYHNMENTSNDTVFNSATSTGSTNNGRGISGWQPTVIPNNTSYPFPFSLGDDTLICGSGSLLLTIPPVYSSYLWNNGSTSNTRLVSSSGNYIGRGNKDFCWTLDTINVTYLQGANYLGNDTTLCEGDSLLLIASVSGATYLWSDGSTDSTLLIDSTGTFWVRISVSGCQFYDSITVSFNSYPIVDLGDDTLVCGSQLILDAGNPGSTYLWNNGSINQTSTINSTGFHWVEVSNGICSTTDSVMVDLIDLSFNLGMDTILCNATSIILSSPVTANSYSWNTGQITSAITVDTPGEYLLTVQDSICSFTDSIRIDFQELSARILANPTVGCEPLTVNFSNSSTINIGAVTQWEWVFGDGNNAVITNPIHTYATSGTYSVNLKVTSSIRCSFDTTYSNLITVHPLPKASFSINPDNPFMGEQVSFTNNSTSATNYTWLIDNIYFSNAIAPVFSFPNEGVFQVTLIASNVFGCSDTIVNQAVVNSGNVLFAPNSFTPNEDDFNNEWKMYSNENIDRIEISIFNRWGENIFNTNDITKGWDGKHQGEESPIGTYTWKAKIRFKDKSTKLLYGHIELIR